jgi:hypothetical protein
MMAMTNTYDEKIMNFNGSFFEDLMALFTDEEISEMRYWLEDEIGYDYDFLEYDDGAGNYKTEEEKRNIIIVDYIRELLCVNIKSGTRSGTRHLFNIVYKMF